MNKQSLRGTENRQEIISKRSTEQYFGCKRNWYLTASDMSESSVRAPISPNARSRFGYVSRFITMKPTSTASGASPFAPAGD